MGGGGAGMVARHQFADHHIEDGREHQPEAGDAQHAEEHGGPQALAHLGARSGADQQGWDLILFPEPPVGEEWDGVRDRLQRACIGSGPSSSSHANS